MCYVETAAELHHGQGWANMEGLCRILGLLFTLWAGRMAMGRAWANMEGLCRMSVSLAKACDELADKCSDVEVAVRMRFTVQCVVVIVWGAREMFRRISTLRRARWGWWWWAMVAAAVVAPAMALAAAVSGIAVAAFLGRGICKYLRPLGLTDARRAVVCVFITPILSCIGLAMGVLLAAAIAARRGMNVFGRYGPSSFTSASPGSVSTGNARG